MTRPSEQCLHALGVILRARREHLGRPQDLRQWGGPSDFTVRGLEQADGNVPRTKTRRQLELALNFPVGMIDRVLSGEVTEDSQELDEVVVRDTQRAPQQGEPPSIAAFLAQPQDEDDEDAVAEQRHERHREEFEVTEGLADTETRRRVVERARGRGSTSQHFSSASIPVSSEGVAEALRGEGFAVQPGDTLSFASGAAERQQRAVAAVQRAVEFRASGPLADALSALYRLLDPTPAEHQAIAYVQQALDAVQREKYAPQNTRDVHDAALRSSTRDRHVVPTRDGSWQVQKRGAQRASAKAATQAEAIARASEILSRDGGGKVVVHGSDGKVRESLTIRGDGIGG